ncbi:MAG: hypothetical protein AAF681_02830 [Pseudomonadota bacterium]
MSARRWHIVRSADHVVLARRLPARFDIAATTTLPQLRLIPLVHLVRQDIWRALRGLRGFSPVIEARLHASGVTLRAGGPVAGLSIASVLQDRLRAVLDDRPNRERWQRCAR